MPGKSPYDIVLSENEREYLEKLSVFRFFMKDSGMWVITNIMNKIGERISDLFFCSKCQFFSVYYVDEI